MICILTGELTPSLGWQVQRLEHALQQTEQQQASEMQAARSLAVQASSAADAAAAAVETKLGSVEAALASAQARLQQQTHVSYKMSRERNQLTKQVSNSSWAVHCSCPGEAA